LAKSRIADYCHPSSDTEPHIIYGSFGHASHPPKRHLDRFIRFVHSTSVWSAHKQTHRPRYSVCSKRPHLMHWVHAMRPQN